MKRFDRQMHNRFNLYLASVFGVIVLFFLLQTYVAQFKSATPTGAIVSTPNDIFELVGPPTSNTKIVTGSTPTPAAFRVAEYYASDYALCGNGVIDEMEDCELSGTVGEEVFAGYECRNCRFVGDGRVDYLDPTTGLMEECDPGAPKFIPAIPAVNSCSGGQCSSAGSCPSGGYSTSLCAYGIYKNIVDGSSVFASYLNALGNLHCEENEAMPFDCLAQRSECGITQMEYIQLDSETILTRDDVINMLVQGGVSQSIAEIMSDSRQLFIKYSAAAAESAAEVIEPPAYIISPDRYEMKLIIFPNGTSLLDYFNEVYAADVINTAFGDFSVYISNSSQRWVWYVGRVMFVLTLSRDFLSPTLTLGEKQQGNAVLAAYLNQFGSDVPSAAAQAPIVAPITATQQAVVQQGQTQPLCGNTIVEVGEQCDDGNTIDTDACINCWNARCGDGYARTGVEQCDDGNSVDGDGCSSACLIELCPNGQCDVNENPSTCPADCPFNACGNNLCEAGEILSCPGDCIPSTWCGNQQCDAGETSANCPGDCFCGNSVVEAGEQCEPPNTAACDANCQTITTGVPAHCSNSVWDGDESDLNCGGSCNKCPPAGFPTYLSCWVNNDCQSNNCVGAAPLPIVHQLVTYTTYDQIRQFAGASEIIQYQGTCQ